MREGMHLKTQDNIEIRDSTVIPNLQVVIKNRYLTVTYWKAGFQAPITFYV